MMKNNIFSYATSELSQDAFLCWLLMWGNEPKHPLHAAANSFFQRTIGDSAQNIESVKIYRQVGDRQNKIDILALVNERYYLIIEDKTNTTQHGDQLNRYAKLVKDYLKENQNQNGIVKTVYLKTGFMYPYDHRVEADCHINVEDLFHLLRGYWGHSEIMDSYLYYLQDRREEYRTIETYFRSEDDTKLFNNHYGQYLVLDKLFPGHLLNDFSHGSSFGRPWSNTGIATIYYPPAGSLKKDDSTSCNLFLRIDTDSRGQYLSLRQYDWFHTVNSQVRKTQKIAMFNELKQLAEKTITHYPSLNFKLGGNNGNYKESEIIAFYVGSKEETKPQNAPNQLRIIFEEFPKFTREFLEACSNQYSSSFKAI